MSIQHDPLDEACVCDLCVGDFNLDTDEAPSKPPVGPLDVSKIRAFKKGSPKQEEPEEDFLSHPFDDEEEDLFASDEPEEALDGTPSDPRKARLATILSTMNLKKAPSDQ